MPRSRRSRARWSARCPTSGCWTRPWCRRPSSSSSRSRATTSSPACWRWTATCCPAAASPAGHRGRRRGTWAARRQARPTGSTRTWSTRTASACVAAKAQHRPAQRRRRPSSRATSRRTGSLGLTQPRVYFGQQETSYAIVGGPPGRELDYPEREPPAASRTHIYTGGGGVPVGSPAEPLPVRHQVPRAEHPAVRRDRRQLEDPVHPRPARPGGQKVAPFLTLDGDPYPVVANGADRGSWTATPPPTSIPYSERISLPRPPPTATAPAARSPAADRRDQLHPQLGQGGGRRLHRRGHPLPVGHRRPGAARPG